MNVSLGNRWERFVDAKVKSGDFQTASEVLRAGLRLLEERELLKRISVSSMEELKATITEAVASLDGGEGINGEEAFARLRERIKAHKARG
jgi:antitoxin ParD1/3/4